MGKNILVSAVLATLLFSGTLLAKEVQKEQTALNNEIHIQQKISQNSSQEIIKGFNDTLKAVQALEKDDVPKAKKYLQEAMSVFDNALKSNPDLKLLPVSTQIEVNEIDASPRDIKHVLKLIEKAVKDHHLEDARVILNELRDEMVVVTQYIPMDVYPITTKDALERLNKGDTKEALAILMSGFSASIVDRVVIPLPILTASDMIVAASLVDKKDKKEALALLDGAKEELEKAKLLGYEDGFTSEYVSLSKDIDAIQKEINGKNLVEKLYDKLKNSFQTVINKVRGNSYKDSIATKEAKELVQPESLKKIEAAKAKVAQIHAKDIQEAKAKTESFINDAQTDKSKVIK